MKKFSGALFVLVLAFTALVSNESKASSFIVPSYGNGYGSGSPIGYAGSVTKITVGFKVVPGYAGLGSGCYSGGCGNNFRTLPYPSYPVYGGGGFYGGGSHGGGGFYGGGYGRRFAGGCGFYRWACRPKRFRGFSFNLSVGWGGPRGFGGFNLGINTRRFY